MKIQGEHTFEAPRDEVWEALQDPVVLASVMPGCERLEKTGDDAYEGLLKIKVGPVQGDFQGRIVLTDIDRPNGYAMSVDGRGAPGFVKATARVALTAEGDRTRIAYDSDAQVGGRIASVGQRLLDSSAKAIIKQSLEGLSAVLAARTASAEGAMEAPAMPRPPSQAAFAAGVAKEVAKDIVPRPVWIAAAIILLLVVLYLVFR